MTDLPGGFEGYICDKYKMNPATFKLLYENKYNIDLAAYTAGMAQGRKEQAAEDSELCETYDLQFKNGFVCARAIRRATGEQDD